MILRGTLVAFFVSQTAWPMFYVLGSNTLLTNPLVMFVVGSVFIPGFAYMLYKLLPRNFKDGKGVQRKRDLFYYICCLFAWSCTIDLIGALEGADYIDGYFDFYLENGEPYLGSPFGIWIDVWDATVHFAMYLIIIYKIDNGQDYRKIGLYWVGDMLAGMFCLVIGGVVGSYGENIHPATLLNIPYIALPFYALKHLMQLRENEKSPKSVKTVPNSMTFTSYLLFLGLLFSMVFAFVRGLAALGSPLPVVQFYVQEYEPYITEPGKFGAMHCLFNFMYCLPLQATLMYYLVKGNGGTMAENLSLMLAGALAQGSFFHLLPGFYHKTPEEYQITKNAEFVVFANIFPVLISHFLIYKFSTKKVDERAHKTRKTK